MKAPSILLAALFAANATEVSAHYYDAETGTDYNYFRDYDPGIGRYVESDPIGLAGGINTYLYASGSPEAWFDTLGLAACTYSISSHTLSCQPNGGGKAVSLGPNGVFLA